MNTQRDIIAITNALSDLIIPVTDEEIDRLKAGSLSISELENIVNSGKRDIKFVPGGSPANVVANASYLGAKCGLIGAVGNDKIGMIYKKNVIENGIEDLISVFNGERSGVCYALISPSKERYFKVCMNSSKNISIGKNEREKIKEYRLIHTSNYEIISNPESIMSALLFAKQKNVSVSFDLASEEIVTKNMKRTLEIVSISDIVFANEKESKSIGYEVAGEISKVYGLVFIEKLGKNGSMIYHKRKGIKIPAYPCNLINTNGAGDAYAAGFLVSYLNGKGLEECGNQGSKLAARVCEMPGARLGNKNKSN